MMPLNGSGKCYPLFEQGPCNYGEWFVLKSANNVTLLPYAQCENVLDCDVFTLKEDFEGKNILCANFRYLIKTVFILFPTLNCMESKSTFQGIKI